MRKLSTNLVCGGTSKTKPRFSTRPISFHFPRSIEVDGKLSRVSCGSVVTDDSPLLLGEEDVVLVEQPSTVAVWNNGALNGVFPLLGNSNPPNDQRDPPPIDLRFVRSVFQNLPQLDSDRLRILSDAVDVVATSSPDFTSPSKAHITWFGEYGCALLAVRSSIGRVQLQLVCPDEWEFQMHSGVGSAGRTHCSHASNDASKLLKIGSVPAAKYQDFLSRTQMLLIAAQERKGDKRSAASNKQVRYGIQCSVHPLHNDCTNACLKV
jgi:hypothetical protein